MAGIRHVIGLLPSLRGMTGSAGHRYIDGHVMRRHRQVEPPKIFCIACEMLTAHKSGSVTIDGALRSHLVCKECGLERIGGNILIREVKTG